MNASRKQLSWRRGAASDGGGETGFAIRHLDASPQLPGLQRRESTCALESEPKHASPNSLVVGYIAAMSADGRKTGAKMPRCIPQRLVTCDQIRAIAVIGSWSIDGGRCLRWTIHTSVRTKLLLRLRCRDVPTFCLIAPGICTVGLYARQKKETRPKTSQPPSSIASSTKIRSWKAERCATEPTTSS
jgi:hypothetical protein